MGLKAAASDSRRAWNGLFLRRVSSFTSIPLGNAGELLKHGECCILATPSCLLSTSAIALSQFVTMVEESCEW